MDLELDWNFVKQDLQKGLTDIQEMIELKDSRVQEVEVPDIAEVPDMADTLKVPGLIELQMVTDALN